jgi:hypothetical protein
MLKWLLVISFVVVCSLGYSQSAMKGTHEREKVSFFRKKLRKQMHHFDKSRKDLLLSSNGTSYRRNRKPVYKVDANGFDMPNQGKRNKKKTK